MESDCMFLFIVKALLGSQNVPVGIIEIGWCYKQYALTAYAYSKPLKKTDFY